MDLFHATRHNQFLKGGQSLRLLFFAVFKQMELQGPEESLLFSFARVIYGVRFLPVDMSRCPIPRGGQKKIPQQLYRFADVTDLAKLFLLRLRLKNVLRTQKKQEDADRSSMNEPGQCRIDGPAVSQLLGLLPRSFLNLLSVSLTTTTTVR